MNRPPDDGAARSRARWNPWPWGLALGMAVAMGMNVALLVVAVRRPPVLEDRDPYERGIAHQTEIDAQRASDALGWSARVEPCGPGWSRGGCELRFTMRDAQGRAVVGLTGRVHASRADDASLDREADFVAHGQGQYVARLALWCGGLYRIEATLEKGEHAWLDRRRVVIPAAVTS